MTTPTPLSRIPQPMYGMNWEPAPSTYTSIPAPTEFGDTDFANDDFVALWDVDGNGVGRHDLKQIKELGCNTIKMYNWSVPAPNGYWLRNHVNFLAMAATKGLSVIVPISNYFTGTAYTNRVNGSSTTDLQNWITGIVTEVYQGLVPGAAIMWAIGNEFDNSNVGAWGYCEAQDIAMIASYIVAAETALNITPANVLAFTSPVTTALIPANTSIPSSNPTYNTLMGGCAIAALIDAFNTALGATVTAQRFVAAINSYQIGAQLTAYATNFPTVFPDLPYFYGELGFSAAAGESTQAANITSQFSFTVSNAQPAGSGSSNPFLGACCFEYTDELWKGSAGSSETMFGLNTFTAGATPPTSTEGNHAPVWGASYPVDALQARAGLNSFEQALAGG